MRAHHVTSQQLLGNGGPVGLARIFHSNEEFQQVHMSDAFDMTLQPVAEHVPAEDFLTVPDVVTHNLKWLSTVHGVLHLSCMVLM